MKGRAASDLSSTHPPISERIRILRSMAGGASMADYSNAYMQVHKSGKSVIPVAAVAAATPLTAREAPAAVEKEPDKLERTRETSDVLWKYSDYGLVDCECGTRLRFPPKLKGKKVRCPHCGRINTVPGK
jgi:heat shock protein HtpX